MMITSKPKSQGIVPARSALTDDGRPRLMPLVAASKRLTQIQESLERLSKGGCQQSILVKGLETTASLWSPLPLLTTGYIKQQNFG